MFFSGQVELFRCTACEQEASRAHSTAFLYWVALIGVGGAVLLPVLNRRFGHHFAHQGRTVLLVGAAELLLVALLVWGAERWQNRQAVSDLKCPRCAAPVQRTGSGFYDFGLLPTSGDVFVGLGFLLAHAIVITLLIRTLPVRT